MAGQERRLSVGTAKWLLPLLLAACSTGSAPPPPAAATDASASYRVAAAAGKSVYAVDPASSLLVVTVRRAGVLARLGHDHVVASHRLAGFVSPSENRADLTLRPDEFTVDETALRREAGFTTVPSPQAIEGTRNNMLTRVLDAARFPVVRMHAERLGEHALRVAITLHGVTRLVDLPATVQIDPRQLSASGSTRLRQSDFGITPLAVAGGLLAVRDEFDVRFRIVALRAPAAPR
jgi:polyisoprenoid-binding protein YceI